MSSYEKYRESIDYSYQHVYRMYIHSKNIIEKYKSMEHVDDITAEVYRDSIIKKYELLEDLLWKLLSKIFKAKGLMIHNPRDCYKQAFKEGWIDNIEVWNNILQSRNSTAHIYNEADYEKIKQSIINEYIDEIEKLLFNLNESVIADVRNSK